jgi:hypothetical protein
MPAQAKRAPTDRAGGTRAASLRVAAFVLTLTLAPLAALLPAAPARADDMISFKVQMKDGAISPDRIEVDTGKPFRIDVTNAGSGPAEFESSELHKEKVLMGGGTGSLIFRSQSGGTYVFFDDFHPDGSKLTLVVK